jgi:uncharacterized membrane protein HdeD (DUF308 family)
MQATLSKNWWMFLIRGIAGVLFGIAVFLSPGVALTVIIAFVAAYFLVDGFFTTIYAIQHRAQPRWWVTLLEGIIGIVAGIGALILGPLETGIILLYVIAFWAILTGVTEIILAIQMRKEIENEWWMILSGILSVVFGVLLIFNPILGGLTLLWLVASYAIVFGIFMIIFAFRVRGMGGQPGTSDRAPAAG